VITVPFAYPGDIYDEDEFPVLCPEAGEIVAFSCSFLTFPLPTIGLPIFRLQDEPGMFPAQFIELEIPFTIGPAPDYVVRKGATVDGSMLVNKNSTLFVRAVRSRQLLPFPPPGAPIDDFCSFLTGYFQLKES
jgi:hypothetical protein